MSTSDVKRRIAGLTGQDFWRTAPWPEFGAPTLWLSDGPHGLRRSRDPNQLGLADPEPATCFPTAAGLAASWDEALVEEVGRTIGREAREQGVHVVLGPGLNLKRHPFGGRNFEYFSEDPLLSGKLAAAWVRGCQAEGVGACLKHFVANNQERHRMVLDVVVDERTLRELYLRGFEIAVTESSPAAVMAAYNLVNGVYATEHERLIGDVLRGEWGFDGFVVSDWGAVADRARSLRAGLDLEMPGTGAQQVGPVLAAVTAGELSDRHVDECVARLVEAADRFGRAPVEAPGEAVLRERHALARRAAAQCCVLLRNERGALPLTPGDDVVLIGALAAEPRYQGAGSSGVVPRRLVSIRDAMAAAWSAPLPFAEGYPVDGSDPAERHAEAVALARSAAAAVVVLGLPPHSESEGFDRTTLSLPDDQIALIEAVSEVCDRVVVVLCNGSPVALPWVDQVHALVEAYLGGQAGGEGVVDVLIGAVNPSGRLPETFVDVIEDHLAHQAWPNAGRQVRYREALYVGYRWFDSVDLPVRFPFGHGLSYTSFGYGPLTVTVEGRGPTFEATVTLEVVNEGAVAGAEVVQLYVHDPVSTVYRPAQELRAFSRVWLEPGEARTVTLPLDRRAFAVWSVDEGAWVVESGAFEIRVGASSRDIRQRATVAMASDDPEPAPRAPRPYHRPDPASPPDDAAFAVLYGSGWSEPQPRRPFHRNSTLGDLRDTAIGGALYWVALREAIRTLGGQGHPALRKLAEAAVGELPLRGLVTTARALSWSQLDALLATLNGQPFRALGHLWPFRGPGASGRSAPRS